MDLHRFYDDLIRETRDTIARVTTEVLSTAPPARGDVRVVSIGKGAPLLARAVTDSWGPCVVETLVVCPDGTPDEGLDVMRASHPLPDLRSVAAATAALEVAGRVREDGLLLAMISGGASALVCAPSEGVSLDAKVDVTRALLASGANIAEINTVRRHLSRIKGGGLARAAAGPVLTCLEIDVVGPTPAPHDVGSGPSVPDPTTCEDARAILWKHAPAHATLSLVETLKPSAARPRIWSIATPELLAATAASLLRAAGFTPTILSDASTSVEALVAEYATAASRLRPGEALVRAAEPTLRITTPSPGRGGRSTHLAALVARHLPPNVVFLSAASDGADGPSGTSGAWATASLKTAPRYAESLTSFDTASLHEAAGTALPGAPTGVNLCDAHVLFRV